MSFFTKMKDRLFKSQSKLDEGLENLVAEGDEVVEEISPPPPAPEPAPRAVQPPVVVPEPAPVPAAPVAPPAPQPDQPRPGFLGRAIGSVTGTRTVRKRILDDDMLEELEEVLITADMGVETSMKVSAALAEGRFGRATMTGAADGRLIA